MRLTQSDEAVLKMALRENAGFHVATQWYLRDWEPLPYQYVWHHSPILNTTCVQGIGSGKTASVAASYLIDCLTLPYFKGLNASVTATQAELAYNMVMGWMDRNPRLEKFVTASTLRPYPILTFWNGSMFEFRTAGQGAKFIRGKEYDRINYDEAGLDFDGEAIRVLRGRLRGRREDGRIRMARLDVTTTPTGATWLRERFDKGLAGSPKADTESLKSYLSFRVSTYENTKLTKEQIALMEAEYPPELIEVELNAQFPDWGLSTFPHSAIQACVDANLNDRMYLATNPEDGGTPKPDYKYTEWPRVGCVHYEVPFDPHGMYVIAGDPGTDIPPRRNAAVVGVFDIAKNPWEMVYFSWINGNGSYRPFLANFEMAAEKYGPVVKAIDATGPQKAIDELGFEEYGLVVDPMNFGSLKDGMINSLSLRLTAHGFRMPMIKGVVDQLQSYRREEDTKGNKIEQDIVMMMAMVAHAGKMASMGMRGNNEKKKSSQAFRRRNLRTVPFGGRHA